LDEQVHVIGHEAVRKDPEGVVCRAALELRQHRGSQCAIKKSRQPLPGAERN
jgi:hypothetical protein